MTKGQSSQGTCTRQRWVQICVFKVKTANVPYIFVIGCERHGCPRRRAGDQTRAHQGGGPGQILHEGNACKQAK